MWPLPAARLPLSPGLATGLAPDRRRRSLKIPGFRSRGALPTFVAVKIVCAPAGPRVDEPAELDGFDTATLGEKAHGL